MSRTNAGAVRLILGNDYGPDVNGDLPSLEPYIEAASALVDDVVTRATADSVTFSTARRELVERWLAAHYYTVSDPIYLAKRTQQASGNFKDRSYYDVAAQLDPTGLLEELKTGRKKAVGMWLGKPPSEQIDYYQRD